MSMNQLLTSLDEHKIDNEKYHISTEFFTNYSFLFYGFEIKNKFDESRLLINKKISPIIFSGFSWGIKTRVSVFCYVFFSIPAIDL